MCAPARRAGLALDAVLDIASAARPDPVQSRDVTGWFGVPRRRLERLMQDLLRAGVLRGLRGGHALARGRRRITIVTSGRRAATRRTPGRPPAPLT
jgi:DNA-binding IscR family transcriptional regulator